MYAINHCIDGDTMAVNMDRQSQAIRFIAVDTPETHKPNTPVQCYGPAAAAYTKRMIGSGRVRLAADSLSTNGHRYNGLLRYNYLPAGTLLSEALIPVGYGFYYPYIPFSNASQFKADELAAIAAHNSLGTSCTPMPTDSGGYLSNTQST